MEPMGQPSALFLKIPMTKAAYGKWMAAPIKHVADYDDWREMNPVMAAHYDEWSDSFYKFSHATVGALMDAALERSEFFCCEYDAEEKAAFVADVAQDANPIEIAIALAALRSAEAFADDKGPGFIYVYPALSGGDPDALVKFEGGASKFLPIGDASPEVLYFISEAEEFIEALLEDEDLQ